MCIWDGAVDQPFWEREALQLAAEGYEPEEIDLAPGTESPRGPEGEGPHEPSKAQLQSWDAARRLWAEIQRLISGAQRMITARLVHLLVLVTLGPWFCSAAAAQATEATSRRTPGMAGEVHCVHNLPVVEPPLPWLEGLERAENIRHEAAHASQFSVGCDSIAALWEREPFFRLALEADATCIGLRVYADSTVRRYRKGLAAARIAQSYLNSLGNTVGFEDVYAELDRYCG